MRRAVVWIVALGLSSGCAGDVVDGSEASLVDDGEGSSEPCVERNEGGNDEVICAEGEAPPQTCQDLYGPGWSEVTDSSDRVLGCACTSVFCGGGGGPLPPPGPGTPPPGGGGGGDAPPPRDPDRTRICFESCDAQADWDRPACVHTGYDRAGEDPPCVVPSIHSPGHCAGVDELCRERNLLPNGRPLFDGNERAACANPPSRIVRRQCDLALQACQEAWLATTWSGSRTLAGSCLDHIETRQSDCRERCLDGTDGLGCRAELLGDDGQPTETYEGHLEGNQCESRLASTDCTAPQVRCDFFEAGHPAPEWDPFGSAPDENAPPPPSPRRTVSGLGSTSVLVR